VYEDVNVRRPYPDWASERKIDILVLVSNIALVIEDKKHANPHSDQLQWYPKITHRDFPNKRVALIYLKTGKLNQREKESVHEAGFHLFGHQDLLPLLEQGEQRGIKNEIFVGYLCWLRLFVAQTRSRKRHYSVSEMEQLQPKEQIMLVMNENNVTYDKRVKPNGLKALPFRGKQFMPTSAGILFDPQSHASSHAPIHWDCQTLADEGRLCKEVIGKGKKTVNFYYLPPPAPDAPPTGSCPDAGQSQTPNGPGPSGVESQQAGQSRDSG
jgi:hypothetical protein